MIDRTPRPCLHPQARHEHGTRLAYTLDGCRCYPCARARSQYQRQLSYGRSTYVDAGPARAHVLALREAGLGMRRIEALAGVSRSGLQSLLVGRTRDDGRHEGPKRKVTRRVAEALLAVPLPGLDTLGGGALVDGTGTRRRLQALSALGWSNVKLARELGMTPSNYAAFLRRDRVLVEHARAVRDLYDRLGTSVPAPVSGYDAAGITRVRRHAAELRWAPPLAWDDETIDDPAARPNRGAALRKAEGRAFDEVAVQRAVHGDRVPLHPAERAEAVRRLAAHGYSDARIAERLGVSQRTAQRLSREPSGQETA